MAVVQQAYVNGVSTRKVDRSSRTRDLGWARTRSPACAEGSTSRSAFPRPAARGRLPVPVARREGRASPRGRPRASEGLVIAYAVHEIGAARDHRARRRRGRDRERSGPSSCAGLGARPLGRAAVRVGRARGPAGGDRQGPGCPWQRCTVHFLRSMLGHCAKAQQPMIATVIRPIFRRSRAMRRGRGSPRSSIASSRSRQGRRSAARRRGRRARLLRLSQGALVEAAEHG